MSQLINERDQQVHAGLELVTALKVSGINPSLKVILVGEDPANDVRNKGKRAAEVGIEAETVGCLLMRAKHRQVYSRI